MTCSELDILLADFLDGTLPEEERASFAAHLAACPACSEYAAEVQSATLFLERVADVDAPPELYTRILHSTAGGWSLKLRRHGIRGWINRTFAPVLQPRFVMGAMLTLMSITMLSRCAGEKKTLTAADLDPVRIWSSLDDRTHRVWDRAVKSYESMRLVYQVRSQINDWRQQQQDQEEAAADAQANGRKLESVQPDQKQMQQNQTPKESK